MGKEVIKLSSFAGDMSFYLEDPKNSIKRLLELLTKLGNVAGYKINTEKPVAFLYTNNKPSEKEIR